MFAYAENYFLVSIARFKDHIKMQQTPRLFLYLFHPFFFFYPFFFLCRHVTEPKMVGPLRIAANVALSCQLQAEMRRPGLRSGSSLTMFNTLSCVKKVEFN